MLIKIFFFQFDLESSCALPHDEDHYCQTLII